MMDLTNGVHNDENEDGSGDDLVEESIEPAKMSTGIWSKDVGSGFGASDTSDSAIEHLKTLY